MRRQLAGLEPTGGDEAAKIADLERLALEMVEKNPGDSAGDNETIPAGYTYFGQFVDHDLTFDPRSSLQKAGDPDNLENFRTPAFDLDCVYGRGPDDQPYMYDGGKFLIGDNGQGDEDLVRNSLGRAIIGDKRNDENIIVSQLQLVFLKFHNAVFAVEKISRRRSDRWRYILEEAMVQQKGKRLGEVGSRIVAETFIGLLAADPSSYYASFPNWAPTLAKQGKNFKLKHVVQVAGAHIAPPP